MYKIWSVGLIIVYVLLLIFAIHLLINGYICDDHTCSPMIKAKKQSTRKKEQLHLLTDIGQDGIWPFAYIASSILCALFFSILPMLLTIQTFIVVFLVTFIVFFCIIGFFIHHYIVPIKKYIMTYIENDKNDN